METTRLLRNLTRKKISFSRDGSERLLSGLPGSKEKYEDVTAALTAHSRPKKNKWAERYRFRKRAQKENETLDTFIAELRVLSLSCDFGETVEDNILGQVITTLTYEKTFYSKGIA